MELSFIGWFYLVLVPIFGNFRSGHLAGALRPRGQDNILYKIKIMALMYTHILAMLEAGVEVREASDAHRHKDRDVFQGQEEEWHDQIVSQVLLDVPTQPTPQGRWQSGEVVESGLGGRSPSASNKFCNRPAKLNLS